MCAESGTASLSELFPGKGLSIVRKVKGKETETPGKNKTEQKAEIHGSGERKRSVDVRRFRIDRFPENV